jgi:hypothetical protein
MNPRIEAVVYSDLWRTTQLALLGFIFGWLAYSPALNIIHVAPGLQNDLHGFAVLCLRGTLGYWFARICLTRLPKDVERVGDNIPRAILVGFSILARATLIGMVVISFK